LSVWHCSIYYPQYIHQEISSMFGLGKKKSNAPIDKAAAIKKAAAKGIFIDDSPTPVAPVNPPVPVSAPVPVTPSPVEVSTAPVPAPAPAAVTASTTSVAPAPKATKAAKAAKSAKAPKVAKAEPTPAPVAPKPAPKPAPEIRFSNGEPYLQFARRRPGANMKGFLEMAKQVRGNG
jgi:hypothetical protein